MCGTDVSEVEITKKIKIPFMKNINPELLSRLRQFIEDEARSCSMDPALITPEYVHRMWGGKVGLDEITDAMKAL